MYKSNFILIIFFKLSLSLGFDNLENQPNKLCLHYTIHKNQYKEYHKDHSSVNEYSQEEIDLKLLNPKPIPQSNPPVGVSIIIVKISLSLLLSTTHPLSIYAEKIQLPSPHLRY